MSLCLTLSISSLGKCNIFFLLNCATIKSKYIWPEFYMPFLCSLMWDDAASSLTCNLRQGIHSILGLRPANDRRHYKVTPCLIGRHDAASSLACNLRQAYLVSRADTRLGPSQWETSLQTNAVSHWLGTNLVSTLSKDTLITIIRQYSNLWAALDFIYIHYHGVPL